MFTSALIDEAMAHSYYSPEGLAFEHQHKTDGFPVAHPMRDGSQPEMLDRSVDCVSPSQELDGKTRNSTRRRIQVAVCLPRPCHLNQNQSNLNSAIVVARERLSAAVMPVTAKAAPTAVCQEITIVSSYG